MLIVHLRLARRLATIMRLSGRSLLTDIKIDGLILHQEINPTTVLEELYYIFFLGLVRFLLSPAFQPWNNIQLYGTQIALVDL
jgi:hypothetical protein